MLELVRPSGKYRSSWIEALREFEKEGDTRRAKDLPMVENDWSGYLDKIQKDYKGVDLGEGRVPQTVFWLAGGGEALGTVSIRHEINDHLQSQGGHIGYAIRPSERKKGYGTRILELALIEVRKLDLKKVLLTCNKDNVASRKIIEANGGILENEIEVQGDYEMITIQRFWIKL